MKLLTLIGGLIATLFVIGSWWGETQFELRAIGSTVKRVEQDISEFARRSREVERTVDGHEYRLRALESGSPASGGAGHGVPRP